MSRRTHACLGLIILACFNSLPTSYADQAEENSAPNYMLADHPGEALVYESERFWFKPVIGIAVAQPVLSGYALYHLAWHEDD